MGAKKAASKAGAPAIPAKRAAAEKAAGAPPQAKQATVQTRMCGLGYAAEAPTRPPEISLPIIMEASAKGLPDPFEQWKSAIGDYVE